MRPCPILYSPPCPVGNVEPGTGLATKVMSSSGIGCRPRVGERRRGRRALPSAESLVFGPPQLGRLDVRGPCQAVRRLHQGRVVPAPASGWTRAACFTWRLRCRASSARSTRRRRRTSSTRSSATPRRSRRLARRRHVLRRGRPGLRHAGALCFPSPTDSTQPVALWPQRVRAAGRSRTPAAAGRATASASSWLDFVLRRSGRVRHGARRGADRRRRT